MVQLTAIMVFSLKKFKKKGKALLKAKIVPKRAVHIEEYIPKMVSQFLNYFNTDLPSGKKSKKPVKLEYLLHLTMYINFLDLYIRLIELKCFNSDDQYEAIQYCTTLAVLDEELEIQKYMYEKIEQKSPEGYVPEIPEERMKDYIRLGMKFRQQYKLSDCKEAKHQAKGMEEAVKILLRIREDIEICYLDSKKKKSSNRSLLNRVLKWAVKRV